MENNNWVKGCSNHLPKDIPDGTIERPYTFLKALYEAQRLQRQRYREGCRWCDLKIVCNSSVEYFYVHSNRNGDYIYYIKETKK